MSNFTIDVNITADPTLIALCQSFITNRQDSKEIKNPKKQLGKKNAQEGATPEELSWRPLEQRDTPFESEDAQKGATPEMGVVTVEMLRAKGADLARAGKTSIVKEALQACNAVKISELTKEDYAKCYQLMGCD